MKTLWFFNWIGGGYNTVLAASKNDAIQEIERLFGTNLKPDINTLVSGDEAHKKEKESNAYYSVD